MNDEQFKMMVDPLVERAIKKYLEGNIHEFDMLLSGLLVYKVEAFEGAGHNYYAVLRGIYDYQNEHPEIEVDKILFNGLKFFTTTIYHKITAEYFTSLIDAQLDYQQQGISPFNIDCNELLEDMYLQINSIKDIFVEESNVPGLTHEKVDEWLNYIAEDFERRRGVKKK